MLVYERLDALADGIAEALLGKGGYGPYRRAGHLRKGAVVRVERLSCQELVPVVEDAGEGHAERLTAARRGKHIPRLELNAYARVVIVNRLEVGRDTG